MFDKVAEPDFIRGEHEVLHFWRDREIFRRLREQNRGGEPWSFLDGPITANNPMGVHHAWGRTYKDVFQRYFAMNGRDQRYQNGFDCQGLWVEVEVEKELGYTTKKAVVEHGIERFTWACKKRVLRFAARQTEQSIRLGYWMDWDDPDELRKLSEAMGTDQKVTLRTPSGKEETGTSEELVARLGNPAWGGSYFTFSTENNETIWTFLKKCHERGKIYKGSDVMPWSGRSGSAYSQMEVADGRKLAVHRSCFARFPLIERENEYLLVWTTTPWTLTSNVAAAVNPELDYVRLQAKRDGKIYIFAKDNLEYPRLAREFKEGFGRPEWSWPGGVPRLRTLAQIFKEQGGYEIVGTVKGKELVGLRYRGPFDDLPAQKKKGGFPEDSRLLDKDGISCHVVVDGGRDSKGSPQVVAGEGTGIVHVAPGCGDVDHVLGKNLGLVSIAPLGEDGRFFEGFGDFTGKEAVAPETAGLVFEKLQEKQLLVAVEDYPHIYPHCWRTGDQLVFRLVDEWFINMDWRDEIMAVTDRIEWLPASIEGREREREWLTNMRDWMISKKRFWGLALPIWVDEETGDFEVIGSLAELRERAVEGFEALEGHTPHRPWIDAVKIKNPKTGNLMTRIQDVGNPWLDAGIVSFSTMHYNTDRDEWKRWYPAHLVTECFPGQFRNWFYALLSMATMMDGTPPFRTLLGHRLVMNEEGQPMHKSDGTAIWFEEAAEQLGVDTMRWMYLEQNPSQDLRFGMRHPDRRVTLETPSGPKDTTEEGHPTCEVVSRPADEIRRRILIPLWNSYGFFINYARLDGFDPTQAAVPVAERPEMDRWILSELQTVIGTCRTAYEGFDTERASRTAAAFIDDLSNWYIRRNRNRFWRSKDAGDRDKLAAYQTLYEVLLTLCRLLAPGIPFLTERMYRNLVEPDSAFTGAPVRGRGPESVHLCPYPEVNEAIHDLGLEERMAAALTAVRLGHKLRDETGHRVRQPLGEMRLACHAHPGASPADVRRKALEVLAPVISDELNVKKIVVEENLDALVRYTYKPNLKTLGPRYGKLLGALRKSIPALDKDSLASLRGGASVSFELDGQTIELAPEDVLVGTEQDKDWVCSDENGLQVALSTQLTPELEREGLARDLVRQIQQLRKDGGLEIQDRIVVGYDSSDEALLSAIAEWAETIRGETLADSLLRTVAPEGGAREVKVGEALVPLWIEKKE